MTQQPSKWPLVEQEQFMDTWRRLDLLLSEHLADTAWSANVFERDREFTQDLADLYTRLIKGSWKGHEEDVTSKIRFLSRNPIDSLHGTAMLGRYYVYFQAYIGVRSLGIPEDTFNMDPLEFVLRVYMDEYAQPVFTAFSDEDKLSDDVKSFYENMRSKLPEPEKVKLQRRVGATLEDLQKRKNVSLELVNLLTRLSISQRTKEERGRADEARPRPSARDESQERRTDDDARRRVAFEKARERYRRGGGGAQRGPPPPPQPDVGRDRVWDERRQRQWDEAVKDVREREERKRAEWEEQRRRNREEASRRASQQEEEDVLRPKGPNLFQEKELSEEQRRRNREEESRRMSRQEEDDMLHPRGPRYFQ